MPRRISDYPDGFTGWNIVSSFGSIISVVATFIFLYALYQLLVKGTALSRNIWSYPQHFTDHLQWLLSRAHGSIEWCLNSPPKPHPFVSLPVQGKINIWYPIIITGVSLETLYLFSNYLVDLNFSNLVFYVLISIPVAISIVLLYNSILDLKEEHIPGVKCPKCAAEGKEQWVIRGKVCPKCGTVCQ